MRTRLGCGVIFGLAIGAWYALGSMSGGYGAALLILFCGSVCAFAAARYGDAFWTWLSRNWRWWV